MSVNHEPLRRTGSIVAVVAVIAAVITLIGAAHAGADTAPMNKADHESRPSPPIRPATTEGFETPRPDDDSADEAPATRPPKGPSVSSVFDTTCDIDGNDVETGLPQQDCDALVALRDATSISDWDSTVDPCEWNGVDCFANAWIDEIVRADEGLTGSIPAAFGGLTRLRVLDLRNNALDGPIPPELADIDHVMEILLEGNQLTGEIPEALATMSSLNELHLGHNQLTGEIPAAFGEITMTQLRLQHNQLTGEIPPELGAPNGPYHLNLGHNQLTGEIPPELGHLDMHFLNLEANQLTGEIPPELGDAFYLFWLHLGQNQLTGEIPPLAFGNIKRLTLEDNLLTGSIPPATSQMDLAQIIDLSGNELSGNVPVAYAGFASLTELQLHDNACLTADVSVQDFLDSMDPDWDNGCPEAPAPIDVTWMHCVGDPMWIVGFNGPIGVYFLAFALTSDLPPDVMTWWELPAVTDQGGSLTWSEMNDAWSYEPAPNFTGLDSFTYTVFNNYGSAEGVVWIEVDDC